MRQTTVPDFSPQKQGYKIYQRFRGLDLSTDQTQIDDSRSPKMVNMISDNGGYPEVRVGWRVLHSFVEGGAVNSVYPFVFDGVKQMIVHVGTRLVRLLRRADVGEESYTEVTLLTGLTDGLSQGFYFGGDLWILTGGEYIHYDGVGAKRVEDEAYVPITSILRNSAGVKSNEAVNLLSPWRKNTFVTDGSTKVFTVDAGKIDAGSVVTAKYIASDGSEVTITSEDPVSETNTTKKLTFDSETGVVTFHSAPPAPSAAGVATLTITFKKSTEGAADKIRKCRVFTTFGVNTGSRVFLAGNPDSPATEYYSGLNDPTYFPDNNFINVGTSSFAIVNYLKYDGELLVIKEDNRQENTVWHHTAEIDSATGTAIFPLREGVSGIGGCARFSCQTLRDDPLFLSPQGVYAPCLTYSMNMLQRNLQCRSERVNVELTREKGLADAVSAVWMGYYLLSVNGHIWLADANQSRDKGGYEWYYWEGVPARCFGVEAENLYFGTADGRLCKMNSDLVDEDGNRLMEAYNDNGAAIEWEWRTRMDSLDGPTINKTLQKRGNGILFKAMTRAEADVYLRTEKDPEGQLVETVQTDRFSFADVDYSRFSFSTTDTQEIIFKKKIKKFKFIQLILKGKALNQGAGVYVVALLWAVNDYAKKKRTA